MFGFGRLSTITHNIEMLLKIYILGIFVLVQIQFAADYSDVGKFGEL
jgi:hypothetical protein